MTGFGRKIIIIFAAVFMIAAMPFIIRAEENCVSETGKIIEVKEGIMILEINGERKEFKIAPAWYIEENNYKFKKDEIVKIKYIKDDGNRLLEIEENGKVIRFADLKGNFFWRRHGFRPERERSMKNRRENCETNKNSNKQRGKRK